MKADYPIIGILFMMLLITPVTASGDIIALDDTDVVLISSNSTLGVTTPIHRWPDIDRYPPPLSVANESIIFPEHSIDSQSNPASEKAINLESTDTFFREKFTPGEYFPDVSIARITKNVWIDNPTGTEIEVCLDFTVSNPDEKYPRMFRVYMDGYMIYEVQDQTTSHDGVISPLVIPDGLHEFVFEVRHGAYGKGWTLERAEISGFYDPDVCISAELSKDELFPLVGVATITEYVYVNDIFDDYDEKLHIAVHSSEYTSRRLTVRINGIEVYTRIIALMYEVTIDVSNYLLDEALYEITVEVKWASHSQWILDYLALERTEAKSCPYSETLGISMSWTPDSAYIQDMIAGLENFVDMLYGATEEQLIITKIEIYYNEVMDRTQPSTWPAHTNIYVDHTYHDNPKAYINSQKMFFSKDHGPWETHYHAITHEFAHAFFGVRDEYEFNNGILVAECAPLPWLDYSIMDLVTYWSKPEFCVRTNHDPDKDTKQEAVLHQSCWETIVGAYPEMYEPYNTISALTIEVASSFCIIIHP